MCGDVWGCAGVGVVPFVTERAFAGAQELLNITVGTKSISPLIWSIESGSLITAKAMLEESSFLSSRGQWHRSRVAALPPPPELQLLDSKGDGISLMHVELRSTQSCRTEETTTT